MHKFTNDTDDKEKYFRGHFLVWSKMDLCRIGLLFISINSVTGIIQLSLNGLDLSDLRTKEAVRVVEGENVLLGCKSDRQNSTISWHKNSAIAVSATLEISSIRLEDVGFYICRVTSVDEVENKSIYVEVLYPASYIDIEGTSTGLIGELFTLKCISDARPEPTYEWRRELANGSLLSRNQTYQEMIPNDGYGLVCIVNSLLITTFDKPRRDTLSRRTSVNSNTRAYVKEFIGGYQRITEGNIINLNCVTGGRPNPKVWWTKVENETFHATGKRLVRHNSTKYFTGDYICHAENTVVTVNKTEITTHDTKVVHITVIESQRTEESPATTTTSNQGDTRKDQCSTEYRNETEQILLISCGIGWTVLLLSIALNVWLYRKKRIIVKKETEYTDMQATPEATDQVQELPNHSQTLPETQPYIQAAWLPDNTGTYSELSDYDRIIPDIGGSMYNSSLESNNTVTSTNSYMEPTTSYIQH